jgi:deazaflavin-dependent oxidoreductase (nitroreductase family)
MDGVEGVRDRDRRLDPQQPAPGGRGGGGGGGHQGCEQEREEPWAYPARVILARISRFLSSQRWLSVRVTRAHAALLRRTRGRFFGRNLLFAPRQRVCAMTTTGRRSGEARTTAMGYLCDGDNVVVVASNSGLDRPPAWWLNLQAKPEAEIDFAGERRAVRARVASPEEHERMWPRFVEQFPGFEGYRSYTTREIPLVVLERRQP